MNYLADSTLNCARVGRVGMLAGRVFQWDNSSGEKCEPVTVFLFFLYILPDPLSSIVGRCTLRVWICLYAKVLGVYVS